MKNDLTDYRKSYNQNELLESNTPSNPLDLFTQWFKEVEQAGGLEEPNAMAVSAIGLDGFPKSRIVLLKKYDENGFVFYTNYNSEKGQSILANPKICLSFFWPNLERQVIIKGEASKEETALSTAYFHSRPRGSQIGAWTSPQSEIIDSREVLISKEKELQNTYSDKEIPKPPHWGGFVVQPISFEFWQGRPNRLHDRILYENNTNWTKVRLAP